MDEEQKRLVLDIQRKGAHDLGSSTFGFALVMEPVEEVFEEHPKEEVIGGSGGIRTWMPPVAVCAQATLGALRRRATNRSFSGERTTTLSCPS